MAKAVARIIADAPPAQLAEVVADVRILAGENLARVNAALPRLLAERAAREYPAVKLPGADGRAVLLTADGKRTDDPPTFYEPSTRQILHIDFGTAGAKLLEVRSLRTRPRACALSHHTCMH